MAEYIEREALGIGKCNPDVFENRGYANGWNSAIDIIQKAPAADVQPVVRGKWIEWWPGDCALIMTGEEMLWMCGECTAKFSAKSNFCPNCGADMRGEN